MYVKEMKDAFSVLIPDGEHPLSLLVARCLARAPEVKVYILSSKRWTLSRFSRHRCLYQFKPIGTDDEGRFEALVEIIKQRGIDIVLPITEGGAKFIATRYDSLSEMVAISPIPNPQALRTAINKWSLNQLACEQHLPAPPSILVTFAPAFYERLSVLEYPVLLKPTSEAGGRGIKLFDNPLDLQMFLEGQDKEQFKNRYLVQSYIPGLDLGLSVLCREGEILAYTIQQGLVAQYLGRLKAMQFIRQENVLENGRTLLSALNWSGVAHIDMRYDSRDRRVKILEVNGRFWGSLMGSLVAGVNFPYLACLVALGIPFPMPQYRFCKYFKTQVATKEAIRRLCGKSEFAFSFGETGWRFLLNDPLPQVLNAVAKLAQHPRSRYFIPTRVLNALDEIAE